MATVRGCDFPDELLYDVENNIWYRENDDETITVGMTSVADGYGRSDRRDHTQTRWSQSAARPEVVQLSNPGNG